MAIETAAEDVVRNFVRGAVAKRKYDQWREGRKRQRHGVIDTVMGHRTSVLYRLTPESIDETFARSDHPLGEIDKDKVEGIAGARDWYPTYAFTHLVHFLMEKNGELPTWQDFHNFFAYSNSEEGWRMLGREAQLNLEMIVESGIPESLARDAMTWRVGNAYYGILRDIFTVVHLRSHGVDAWAHPLADALFRTDAWVGNTVLSVRVRNPRFASGMEGRKLKVEEILGDAEPGFGFHALELEPAETFGVIHLPTRESIRVAAEKLAASR